MRSDGGAEVEGVKLRKQSDSGRGGGVEKRSHFFRLFGFSFGFSSFPLRFSLFPLPPPAREQRGLLRSRSLAGSDADLSIST